MLKSNNLQPDELKRLYFKCGKITTDNLEVSSDFIGDIYFNYGIHKVIKVQVERSSAPTYFYQFAYDQGCSVVKLMHNLPQRKGILPSLKFIIKKNF